jgi:hypothetical protein
MSFELSVFIFVAIVVVGWFAELPVDGVATPDMPI